MIAELLKFFLENARNLCHKSKLLIDYRSIQQLIKMNHLNENEIIQKDQRIFSTIFKTKEIKKENINTLFDSDFEIL
jgi:hypothetical protein